MNNQNTPVEKSITEELTTSNGYSREFIIEFAKFITGKEDQTVIARTLEVFEQAYKERKILVKEEKSNTYVRIPKAG